MSLFPVDALLPQPPELRDFSYRTLAVPGAGSCLRDHAFYINILYVALGSLDCHVDVTMFRKYTIARWFCPCLSLVARALTAPVLRYSQSTKARTKSAVTSPNIDDGGGGSRSGGGGGSIRKPARPQRQRQEAPSVHCPSCA